MGDSFAARAKALAVELQALTSLDQLGDDARWQLSNKLDELKREIQPVMGFMRDLTQSSNVITATRIGIATGLFDALAANPGAALTLDEVVSNTRGDGSLLIRILRLLAANGLVDRVGQKWRTTPKGLLMVKGSAPGMMVIHFYTHLKSHASLLDFLQQHEFRNPQDYLDSPWQYAHNTDLGYFEWMAAQDKIILDAFNTTLTTTKQYRGQDWFEFFPVREKLRGSAASETILVDIGGGIGHDALAFRAAYVDIAGKVVLQDLPAVIESVEQPLPSNFEAQAYDAFTPQTVEGAKIYYMRTVLHDWPDAQAIKLLQNTSKGMNAGSILLINENVMSDDHPSKFILDIDFIMMNGYGSMERTEEQWIDLFQAADFEVRKIWRPTQQLSTHALFEVVPMHFTG